MMGTGGLFGGTRGCWIDQNGPMSVIVHGDAFEVSCTLAALRAAFGMEYYFEARETTVGVSRLRSPIYRSDWIVVTGQQTGREIQLAIMKKNGHELHAIWSALVGAGAVPVGAPPQAGLVAARG
jgi:hypothetical protein